MWHSNNVIVLLNVGQVEVVDLKLFILNQYSQRWRRAYVLADMKVRSEETVIVLDQSRHWTIANVGVIAFPQPVYLILLQLSVGEKIAISVNQ
jgi:hypothetical protein